MEYVEIKNSSIVHRRFKTDFETQVDQLHILYILYTNKKNTLFITAI